MKKLYSFILIPAVIILIPVGLFLTAFTQGPDAGYTGSPSDGKDCTQCHTSNPATNVDNAITTTIPDVGYIPGEKYQIAVTVTEETVVKAGFQITAESAGTKVGTWTITDETRTQLKSNSAVTHTGAGTAPGNPTTSWTMDWTAPSAGTGSVTFYAAINNSNGDGTNQDDFILLAQVIAKELSVGIAEQFDETVGNIYPNPATDHIKVNLPSNSEVKVFDNTGRVIMSSTAGSETLEMDVSSLQPGIYFMNIHQDGQLATRRFIKR